MDVQLSRLKENPAKYFAMSNTADIIVTRRGKRLGRIICEEKAARLERLNAFDELIHCAKTAKSVPDETVYDADKENRLREKGLL